MPDPKSKMNPDDRSPAYCDLTISSGVRVSAARTPEKIALIVGDQQLAFGVLAQRINRVANAVATGFNLQPGDNAAILAPNCLEYIEIVCGVSDAGLAIATPSPRLSPRECMAICNDAKAKILFLHPSCEDAVDADALETVEHIVRLDASYAAMLENASSVFEDRAIPETATFSIPYTSGTTGKPKGVMISHRSRTLGFHGCAVEYGVFGPDDYFYAIAPLCHGAGFAMAMGTIFMGGTCEIAAEFDPEETLRRLHSGVPTGVFFVPTHFHKMFDLPENILSENKGHNLKAILSNAAALPQSTKEQVIEYFGDGLLHELYGSTEAGFVSSLRPQDQLRKTQCVGRAFPNTFIKLLNIDGNAVAPNEIGELFAASPMLFNGYWDRPDENEKAIKYGWVTVGDLARFDEEGYLYIVGRKSDMIISGGINIYPREIEEIIAAHPSVIETAVIGVADEKWGERLVAYVATREGVTPDVESIKASCKHDLASYKIPREIHFIEELPRNASGKILKRHLVDKYDSDIPRENK